MKSSRSAAARHAFNINRRNRLFWPTTCTVIEVIPEKKLAFRSMPTRTIWSYELELTDVGTQVVDTRHAENGVSDLEPQRERVVGRGAEPERELVEGMNASLARIKAAAESWSAGSVRSRTPSSYGS